MTEQEKDEVRLWIIQTSKILIGIPYKFGAEWKDFNQKPEYLDCAELVEGVYANCGQKIPDGSYNQYEFCVPTQIPKPADLGFLCSKDTERISHVFMLFDNDRVIEARTPAVRFTTRSFWEKSVLFRGWRAHPELAII